MTAQPIETTAPPIAAAKPRKAGAPRIQAIRQELPAVELATPSDHLSPLRRAIADAEACLPELRRLDAELNAAYRGMASPSEKVAAREAAKACVPCPDELAFTLVPSDQMVRMEWTYADRSKKVAEDFSTTYQPSNRDHLLDYCSRKGLDSDRLAGVWDQWQERLHQAEAETLTLAQREAETAYDDLQEAWDQAHCVQRELADAVLVAPTASTADKLAAIAAYLRVMDYPTLGDALDGEAVLQDAVCAILNPMLASVPQRTDWDAAFARLEAARKKSSDDFEAIDEAEARAVASVDKPMAEAWFHVAGVPRRVLTPEDIQKHEIIFQCMDPARAAAVKAAAGQYWSDLKAAESREGVPALRYASRISSEEEGRAEADLMATPAPDAEAMALKLAAIFTLQNGCELDDPRDAEAILGQRDIDLYIAWLYRDLRAAEGEAWPPEGTETFCGDEWLDEAIAAGASISHGRLSWPEERLEAARGFDFRDLPDWKKERVRKALRERPRQHEVDTALRTYGDEGSAAWHGENQLYDLVEVCRARWDLRPSEVVLVRDGLVAAGFKDTASAKAVVTMQ